MQHFGAQRREVEEVKPGQFSRDLGANDGRLSPAAMFGTLQQTNASY
jgi:hypothetical protein